MTVSLAAGTNLPKLATDADGLAVPVAAAARTGAHAPADVPGARRITPTLVGRTRWVS